MDFVTFSWCYFSTGMSLAWTSPAFMKIEKKEVDIMLSHMEMSFVAAIPFCGRLFSPIPMSYIMDSIGRRGCLIIGRLMQIIHWFLMYFSHNVWVLYFARFLSGCYSGMSVFVIAVYIGETTHKEVRGRTQAILNVHFLLGAVFETVIGPLMTYDNLIICSASIDIVSLIFMFMIPESPYHYIRKGVSEEAERSLRWLRGVEDISKEYKRIDKYIKRQMELGSTYLVIFTHKASRKAFFICQVLLLIQRCSGMTAIIPYASFIMPDTWWLPNEKGPIVLSVTYLVTCGIGSLFVDVWGRKKFLFFSSSGTFLFMMGCTAWFYMHHSKEYDVRGTEWVAIVCLVGQAAFYSTGYFYIPSLMMSEMFAMNIKAKANALGAIISTLISMIIIFIFLPLTNEFGMYSNFIIYTIASFTGVIYSLSIIETKGRTLEAIQALLEGRQLSESSMSNIEMINHDVREST